MELVDKFVYWYKELYQKSPVKTLFYTILGSTIIAMIIGGLITGGQSIKDMLLFVDTVSGYDFYQPLRLNMAMGTDIYPPFAYFIFLFLGRLIIPTAGGVPSNEFRDTQMGFLVYSVYLIIVYVLLYKIVCKFKEGSEHEKNLFALLMLLSLPSIYLIERANILSIAVIFATIFFFWYGSEDKKKRYVAYLSLAIATGFKLYPAIFGLILLGKTEKKELIHCILIGAAVFLIPFLFTEGTILDFFSNVFNHSGGMSLIAHADYVNLDNLLMIIGGFVGITLSSMTKNIIVIIFALIAVICILFGKGMEKWKKVALITLFTLCLTSFKPIYATLFMVPALIMFLDSNPWMSKTNVLYMICFALLFIPMFEIFFDVSGESPIPLTTIMEAVGLVVMMIAISLETIKTDLYDRKVKGSQHEGR